MASLSEMREYANEQSRSIAGESLVGFLQGYTTGRENRRAQIEKAKQQEFDNTIKLIDAADKMEATKQKQYSNMLMTDVMKSVGVMPYDDNDKAMGREVAGSMLGEGKRPKTDNTMQGRAASLFNNKNFEKYDLEVTAGPTGAQISLKTKRDKIARTAGQEDDLYNNVYKLATETARREYLERLSQEIDPATGRPKYDAGIHNPAQFNPPTELIDKWIPYAQDVYTGNFSGAKSRRKGLESELDPLARKPAPKKSFMDMVGSALNAFGGNK